MKNTTGMQYIKFISGIVAISSSAIFVKLSTAAPTITAFYRCLYASLILFGIAIYQGEFPLKTTNLKWVTPTLFAGLFLGIDITLWHKTIFFIGAGPSTFLGNSQIIFVAIFAAVIFKERISPIFPILVVIIFLGLYLLMPDVTIRVDKITGYLLGLIVGITYASFLICLHFAKNMSDHHYPEILSLSLILIITSLIAGSYGLLVEKLNFYVPDLKNQLLMLAMAIIPQTFGWIMIKRNITHIPAHQGSLLLLLQPILTTVWAFILFSETLHPTQLFGMILAIGGITLYQLKFALQKL